MASNSQLMARFLRGGDLLHSEIQQLEMAFDGYDKNVSATDSALQGYSVVDKLRARVAKFDQIEGLSYFGWENVNIPTGSIGQVCTISTGGVIISGDFSGEEAGTTFGFPIIGRAALLFGNVNIASGASYVKMTLDGSADYLEQVFYVPALSSGATNIPFAFLLQSTDYNETFRVVIVHGNGGSLSAEGFLGLVYIK